MTMHHDFFAPALYEATARRLDEAPRDFIVRTQWHLSLRQVEEQDAPVVAAVRPGAPGAKAPLPQNLRYFQGRFWRSTDPAFGDPHGIPLRAFTQSLKEGEPRGTMRQAALAAIAPERRGAIGEDLRAYPTLQELQSEHGAVESDNAKVAYNSLAAVEMIVIPLFGIYYVWEACETPYLRVELATKASGEPSHAVISTHFGPASAIDHETCFGLDSDTEARKAASRLAKGAGLSGLNFYHPDPPAIFTDRPFRQFRQLVKPTRPAWLDCRC